MATTEDEEPPIPNQSPPSPVTMRDQTENQPNWLDLPREITSKILLKLGAMEILLNAQSVCSQWRSICKDKSMWRNINMRNLAGYDEFDYDFNKMCRAAVDRSSGDLYSINLDYFVDADTLKYITDRCKNIRQLRLMSCCEVPDEGLCEAVRRLPYLEELDLTDCMFTADTIHFIGISCTHLKSFKLNNPCHKSSAKGDAAALAIAKSMRQLHHLQLFGSKMTNEGLKAILDGCPYLESLDLRRCVNVKLDRSLGKKCAEMIKDLRFPCDSTFDYQYNDENFLEDQSDYEDDYEDIYDEDYEEDSEEDWGAYYEEYDDFTIFPNDWAGYDDFASVFAHDCSLTDYLFDYLD